MTYAFDFDETWSKDPKCHEEMVKVLRKHGHDAVIVTGRSDRFGWGDEVREVIKGLIPIVFAGPDYKRDAAEKAGYHIDVWVDDTPEMIGRPLHLIGLDLTPDQDIQTMITASYEVLDTFDASMAENASDTNRIITEESETNGT